jgi:multiple sugar transport system permease protein
MISKTISYWVDKHAKYVFLMPSILFVLLMITFPLIYNVWIGFTDWSMSVVQKPEGVGFSNYLDLFKEPRFIHSVGRTFVFTFFTLFGEVLLGLLLGLFLNKQFTGITIVKTIMLLPMVMTPVAVGMIWMLIYEPNIGIFNYLLGIIGYPGQVDWLGNTSLALWSLMLVDIWEWTPMVALLIMAGLSTLPKEPFESAVIDGASKLVIFWRITLPLISSTIMTAMILRLIDALKTFDIIYAMTQGGPGDASETINIYGYLVGFQYFRYGKAAALLTLFLIIVLFLTFFLNVLKKKLVVEM